MHKEHKILEISDEESLEKENISIESSTKDFSEHVQKIIDLRNKIEKEINTVKANIFLGRIFCFFNSMNDLSQNYFDS